MLNSSDRREVEKIAKADGYRWNADGDKMIKDGNKQLSFSETKQSVISNGKSYNDVHGFRNSSGK